MKLYVTTFQDSTLYLDVIQSASFVALEKQQPGKYTLSMLLCLTVLGAEISVKKRWKRWRISSADCIPLLKMTQRSMMFGSKCSSRAQRIQRNWHLHSHLWGSISNVRTTRVPFGIPHWLHSQIYVLRSEMDGTKTTQLGIYFLIWCVMKHFQLHTLKSHNASVRTANPTGAAVDWRTWNALPDAAAAREYVEIHLTFHKMTRTRLWWLMFMFIIQVHFFNAKYVSKPFPFDVQAQFIFNKAWFSTDISCLIANKSRMSVYTSIYFWGCMTYVQIWMHAKFQDDILNQSTVMILYLYCVSTIMAAILFSL